MLQACHPAGLVYHRGRRFAAHAATQTTETYSLDEDLGWEPFRVDRACSALKPRVCLQLDREGRRPREEQPQQAQHLRLQGRHFWLSRKINQ